MDDGSLANAASCWNDFREELRELDASLQDQRGVPGCLDDVSAALRDLERCAALPERTDGDVLAKTSCLAAYERSDTTCGPLNLAIVRTEVETRVDLIAVTSRLDAKAAPIIARQKKAAADETARQASVQAAANKEKARCMGSSTLQIVLALRVGREVSVRSVKGCKYDVAIGTVQNTTRDGWMIVSWGDQMTAAIKSRKRHADGSYLRTSAKATYLGLGTFDSTGGGSATVATFRLVE